LTILSVAQNDSITTDDNFFDVRDKPSHRFKLGGAGGFTPRYLFLNTKDLNIFLAKGKAGQLSNKGILMYGGEGYGYIMFLKNIRMGGMGASGTVTTENLLREFQLDISYGGFFVGYVQPIAPRFDIALDVTLGGGEMNLRLWRTNNSKVVWDDIWTHFGDSLYSENKYSQQIDGEFYTYQISLNIEYAILEWLGMRVGAGYVGMTSPEWKLDAKNKIVGFPSSISGKGISLNFGIFAGFFGD